MLPRSAAPFVILIVASAAFAIGAFLWLSLFWSLAAEVRDLYEEQTSPAVNADPNPFSSRPDCEDLAWRDGWLLDEGPTGQGICLREAGPSGTPEPRPTATVPPTEDNRFNCEAIRGTAYRSAAERSWFLSNCLTPTPP